jgi:hypothetical protein
MPPLLLLLAAAAAAAGRTTAHDNCSAEALECDTQCAVNLTKAYVRWLCTESCARSCAGIDDDDDDENRCLVECQDDVRGSLHMFVRNEPRWRRRLDAVVAPALLVGLATFLVVVAGMGCVVTVLGMCERGVRRRRVYYEFPELL